MLQAMRSGTKSPIMKFFLLFLAGGFALWGVGDVTTGLIGGSDKAISASDESVSPRDVAMEFERTRRNYLPNSTVGEALQGGLLNEIMGAMSRDVLFRAENASLGLTVTREMQRDAIVNEGSFKDELGNFSEGRFMQTLANAGMSEVDYLRRVDGVLMREQLTGAMAVGARFDAASARIVAAYDQERRRVRLTSFPVLPESIAAPTAAELDAYFVENKSAYDAPELRSATIASISADMIASNLEIDDIKIAAAFESRIDEFSTPETRNIRQMVFDDKAAAETALSRVAAGDDFAAVAADMLQWTEADTDLGTVTKSALDPVLADVAFTVATGTPAGPVETAFGHHILIVDKIIEGGAAELADVKEKIIQTLRTEESINLLYDKANEFEDALGSGATLGEAVAKVGGSIVEINNVSRNGLDIDGNPVASDDADLIQDSAVLDLIWSSELNETSVIQEGGDDMFFAVRVTAQTPQKERSLDEVRNRAIADWKLVQAIKQAKASADAAAKANNDTGEISDPFRRNGLGLDHQAAGLIAKSAFDQPVGKSSVIETGNEAIAVKTVDIVAAKDADIDETSQVVVEVMNNALREDMLNMVLLSLSEKHDLQLNVAPVEQILVGSQQ
ncbi:MAG: peptidyl-prolyl cis-trans isomerase [Candidatus Puniceispirillum sp.]|nr:peptidyl-prolyl cis-trans isomerase [Candidatus Puniceispirillum sp.]MBL6774633.1 peptidyl-prolyl cis-trans isomerase [Candidatus Puniceispirillum sp.]